MPTPSRAPIGLRLSRRSALAAVLAVGGAAAGCTPELGRGRARDGRDPSPAPVEPRMDPDVAVAAAALRAQQSLVDLLEATVARHPRLDGLLAPVLETHRAHAALLDDAVPEDGRDGPSPSASPGGASSGPAVPETPGARRTPVARRRTAALADVVAAERSLTTTTKQHAFRAQSGAFARVLGSMAAAAAQHAAALGSTSGQGGRS